MIDARMGWPLNAPFCHTAFGVASSLIVNRAGQCSYVSHLSEQMSLSARERIPINKCSRSLVI
jgi:hypothetical protein